jgi:hypothetical protein
MGLLLKYVYASRKVRDESSIGLGLVRHAHYQSATYRFRTSVLCFPPLAG